MADVTPAPLSVAVIAGDEADRIEACLQSLAFADEVIVVVDARSRDETLEIARSYGCRTFSKEWLGFARQKQYAVDLARNDWVLILDADERVPEQTAESMTRLLSETGPGVAAYGILRKNFFHGRWIRRCGWWPDRVVRLVNRKKGRFSDHWVHEHWVVNGPVKNLDLVIEHQSFRNYADLIDKMQNYSTLAAMQMKAKGQYAQWWQPPSHGLWTFLRTYFLELGLLEGIDGLIISLLNAGGSFLKYAKLRELWQYGDSRNHEKIQ
ncbi:MAG: glycosyltransferase family 2 protein [Deltaproteobacteria bacterium]|nr:glycosyltransferase family 2 protein [Deltaproteobacteria bacterium]